MLPDAQKGLLDSALAKQFAAKDGGQPSLLREREQQRREREESDGEASRDTQRLGF
jgi:hypothetical protein